MIPYEVTKQIKRFSKNVDFLRSSRPTLQQLGFTPNINYNYDVYSPDTFAAFLKDDYNKRAQLQKQLDSSVVAHNRNIPVYDNEVTRALSESGSSGIGSGSSDSTRVDPGSAAVIGAGINFIGQNLTNSANAAAVSEANEKSIELQRNAQNYNTAMVQYQNEYNSDLNQYLRGLDAGVSPYMAAGAIQGYSGGIASSPSVPNIQSVRYQNPAEPLAYGLNSFAQFELKKRELDIENKNADTNRMNAETEQSYKQRLSNYIDEQAKTQENVRKNLDAATENLDSQTKLNLTKNKVEELEYTLRSVYAPYQYEAAIGEALSRMHLNNKTAEKVEEETKYIGKYAQAAMINALASMKNAEANERNSYTQQDLAESIKRVNEQTIEESNHRILKIAMENNLTAEETKALQNKNAAFLTDKCLEYVGKAVDITNGIVNAVYRPFEVLSKFVH